MKIGRERLRQLLVEADVTFQRTKTWKESNDSHRDAKLDRIEHVLDHHPDRTFAFDEFGSLAIRPVGGSCWAPTGRPQRQSANYHKFHGVRQFHACYSSVTTSCGASCASASRGPTRSGRCRASGLGALTATGST